MPLLIGTRKCLLNGARKRGYRFDFAAGLPASVVAGLGTVGVAGGALVATGIAANGYEMLSDPSLEGNYVAGRCEALSVEGAPTLAQSADAHTGSKAQQFTASASGSALLYAMPVRLAGATYTVSQWAKRTAGSAGKAENLFISNGAVFVGRGTYITSAEYAQRSLTVVMAASTPAIATWGLHMCLNTGVAPYDTVVVDDASCQRQNAIAWFPAVGVNLSLPVALAMPAAPDVTPIDILVRATDALNYWAVRITPNKAGNDTQIIEVVAGVETVRAAADVDWTAAGTDYVLLDVRGPALTVYAMKQGASVWSPAASYATMATQLTSTGIGVQYFSTTAGPTLVDWAPRAL